METAVIFSNNFRSFKEIFPTVSNYYRDCDLYLSTYNENYDYFTFKEKLDLINKHKNKDKVELRKIRASYTPLPEDSVKFIKNVFDDRKFEIVTEDDFQNWYDSTTANNKNLKFNSIQETFFHYGQFWSKLRGLELVKNSGIHYDFVIFNRCDIIPTSNSYLDIVNAFNSLQKSGENTLLAHKISLKEGMLYVNNQYFGCKYNDAVKIFNIFSNKLEELFENPLFLNFKTEKSLNSFHFFGLLLQYAGMNVKTTDFFYEQKIRKEHIMRGINLLDKKARQNLRLEENKLFSL